MLHDFFALAAQQGPPPLIAPGDSTGLLYAAQYANAMANYADGVANYSGLVSPALAAGLPAEFSTDPSGGLFAR